MAQKKEDRRKTFNFYLNQEDKKNVKAVMNTLKAAGKLDKTFSIGLFAKALLLGTVNRILEQEG
jgi:hypothetical protein